VKEFDDTKVREELKFEEVYRGGEDKISIEEL
jgi:hypothetical protein